MKQTAFVALAALLSGSAASAQVFRTIDGSGNNPLDPEMGQADTPLLRAGAPDYGDGLGTPAGALRASAREVSNAVSSQTGAVPNAAFASDFLWQWGQFLDHDIDLSEGHDPAEPFDIPVPAGDPFFDPTGSGLEVIGLNRTVYEIDDAGVRQQVNQITAWIDASNVYGSDQARADELRRFDGTGKLKVTPDPNGDLLVLNLNGFPNAGGDSDTSLFLAGDVRANEQVGLAAMHTLFVREHNWLCDQLAGIYPGLSDELYYQIARALVAAEMQRITYKEFLPLLIGNVIPTYDGYDASLDGSISNEFSTASYRFGHSLLSSSLQRLDANLQVIPEGHLPLMDAFFNPSRIIDEGGIDPLLRGLASQVCNAADIFVVDDVRNFLFGMPGAGGFDLVSLNVQRGRDHGLPSYNSTREAFGLDRKTSFAEVNSDPNVQAALASVYDTVDDIDAWVGGLAEDHVPGALVGELVQTVLADQFIRLRDGDRYFYKRYLPGVLQQFVDKQCLADVIRRNTGIGNEIQDNVFVVPNGTGG